MEAIRGRTSLRASRGGATTVPRQSTSSLSSRTSMNGMVLVPNAATATTVRDPVLESTLSEAVFDQSIEESQRCQTPPTQRPTNKQPLRALITKSIALPDYLVNAVTGSRCSYSSRSVRIGLAPSVRSRDGTSEGWTLSFIRAVGEEEKFGHVTSYPPASRSWWNQDRRR